jgi:hypothetical protein
VKVKFKDCFGCKQSKIIYKRIEGKPYCQRCSYSVKAPKEIKKRSVKKITQDKEYSILRKKFLEEKPYCEIGQINCTHHSTDVHHKEYRGIHTNDVSTWISTCRSCHDWIHLNPKEARKLNFLN